mmetsp:Transcript_37034/g.26928  ORF Transcript_37034/g.26928 Transcript_37034/m.26928 type:complete len:144 (-) Transcript_37034:42-473(-)
MFTKILCVFLATFYTSALAIREFDLNKEEVLNDITQNGLSIYAGETIKLWVKEIPGTGYIWHYNSKHNTQNFVVNNQYESPPPNETPVIGGPGARVYTITAANVAQAHQKFQIKHERSWMIPAGSEFEEYGETFITFDLNIHP